MGGNGTSWSIQPTPSPSGASRSYLNGVPRSSLAVVACLSESFCAAVGDQTSRYEVPDAAGLERCCLTGPGPPGCQQQRPGRRVVYRAVGNSENRINNMGLASSLTLAEAEP
jgi:hypothetical protein